MADMRFNFQQKMQQQFKLSPQMLQSIELIQLPVEDLCERVYKEATKNPAIEITKDADLSVKSVHIKSSKNLQNNTMGDFQMYIENMAVYEESLQEHFLRQLALMELSVQERSLAERLVQNLNVYGFHNERPEKLLLHDDSMDLLELALKIIRNLEPIGCGFDNIQQSLVYQAENRTNFPALGIEILKNHIQILEKKRPQLIKKHLETFGLYCELEELEVAINAIKLLNPNPASQYSIQAASANYVVPEIIVKQREKTSEEDAISFEIDFLAGVVPEIIISSVYKDVINIKNTDSSFAKKAVYEAEQFMASLEYRCQAVHSIVKEIVIRQHDFFCKGPGNLVPFRQKDLAKELQVNEGTVSRIVNGKYLQCEWGIFELKYFFTNSVSVHSSDVVENTDIKHHSKETIKHEILQLLKKHETSSGKKLSDSKLVEFLEQKGITIARRTVAKYRNELNLQSSFDRL